MRLSDIDLRLLRVFKSVAEAGGIVKAQPMLGINQPTISSHIANLERRLNVRLCNRGPKGFSLTDAGSEVLDETNRLLDYMDRYTQRLNEIGETSTQVIRVGVIDCLVTDPACPVHRAIRQTQVQLNSARVRLGIYDYLDCLTELRAGRLDIVILGLEERLAEDLEADHLYDEVSGLYCAADHPCAQAKDLQEIEKALKKARVSAQSFVLDPLGGALDMRLMDEEAEVSQSHIESTAHLVLAGSHVGLMPHHYAAHWVAKGDMVSIAPDTYRVVSEIQAVRLQDKPLKPAVAAFRDALLTVF